jgi:hypothetical protein
MRKLAGLLIGLALLMGMTSSVVSQPPNFSQEEVAYQQALQYIDQHRKSDVSISVVDQAGAPIKGASVSYQQKTHDFIFGFPGSAWATPQSWADSNEARSWTLWSDLCQAVHATVILDWEEWADIEPQRGVFQWGYSGVSPQSPDQVFQRILDHCPGTRFIFLFDDFSGDISWLHQKDPGWVNAEMDNLADPAVFAQFKQDLTDYVYHVVKHYADKKVLYWITENELNGDQVQGWLTGPEKAIEIDQVMVQAIREARLDAKVLLTATWPAAHPEPFEFADQALASGLQVDGISFPAYPYGPPFSPTFYQSYIQRLSSLGKPVFIQETGYPSQNNAAESNWATWSGIHDEPTQAAWDKYMTAVPFGTENVLGVILVSAEDIPNPDAVFRDFGLFIRDGRTKQAYEMYRQLIQGFTSVGTGSTDASGKLAFRGFAGEYTVTVTAPDGRKVEQTIHVSETGGNSFTITLR